jgi:hypothetical protein
MARIAVTHLVEGNDDAARLDYRAAVLAAPDLFEAHYGLAVLEEDAGRAAAALAAALKAQETAPNDVARSAAGAIVRRVRLYASEKDAAPPPERPKSDIRGIDTRVKTRSL